MPLIVFGFHRIAPEPDQDRWNLTVHPKELEHFLTTLADYGLLVSLEDGIDRAVVSTVLRVAITFDDAYFDLAEHVFPMLGRKNWPACVFVATKYAQTGQPFWWEVIRRGEAEVRLLRDALAKQRLDLSGDAHVATDRLCGHAKAMRPEDRDALLEPLRDKVGGLGSLRPEHIASAPECISFGNHTNTHTVLSVLDEPEAVDEIRTADQFLRAHAAVVSPIFAYPNGQPEDFSSRDICILTKLGISGAVTTCSGTNALGVNRYVLKRNIVEPNTTLVWLRTVLESGS